MKLNGLLRSKEVHLESMGETVTVTELPYRAFLLMEESPKMAGPITVKFALGLEEDIEQIADSIPMGLVTELGDILAEWAGDVEEAEKNLDSTLEGASLSH